MKKLLVIFWTFVLTAGLPVLTMAQCAMCRTQLENNVSNGEVGIAAGINTGIFSIFL